MMKEKDFYFPMKKCYTEIKRKEGDCLWRKKHIYVQNAAVQNL